MMETFEQWMSSTLPDGHSVQDELRLLYLQIEQCFSTDNIDRRRLFLAVCRAIYANRANKYK
jgi:hypothetical protein